MLDSSSSVQPAAYKLPYRVNFVCKYVDRWRELFSGEPASLLDPDSIPHRIISISDCWIICTYLRLAAVGADVRLVSKAVPGEISITDGRDIAIRNWTYNTFLVCCRGDCQDPTLADWVIAQNSAQTSARKSSYVPHWPQPGLIPRDSSRGSTLIDLSYKGHIRNLDAAFKTASFKASLAAIGIQFHMELCDDRYAQTAGWNDYRITDALLAARNLTIHDAQLKPASKLVNAWAAGVPALLGPEPAFQELRRSELDYIEIRSAPDALNALRKLKEQPALYDAMVANGLKRAAEFTAPNIVKAWIAVLGGPIAEEYERWQAINPVSRALRYAARSLKFKSATRTYIKNINNGPRILQDA